MNVCFWIPWIPWPGWWASPTAPWRWCSLGIWSPGRMCPALRCRWLHAWYTYIYIHILYVYMYTLYIFIYNKYIHIYIYFLVCTYLYACFMIIYVKDNQYICRCIHAHVFLVMQARKVNYTVVFWLIPGVFLNGSFYVCTPIIF